MPIKAIHHLDLAVRDVERSLAFYTAVFGPLGVEAAYRYATYRGSEEVVYLRFGSQLLGFRPADGGEHTYYNVGLEHLAFTVDTREELEQTYARCLEIGAKIHYAPEEDSDIPGYWALFVFDPDGFRIEIVHWPDEHDAPD